MLPTPTAERRQSGSMRVEELDIWGDDGAQMTKEEIKRRPSMRPLQPGEEDDEEEVQLELQERTAAQVKPPHIDTPLPPRLHAACPYMHTRA